MSNLAIETIFDFLREEFMTVHRLYGTYHLVLCFNLKTL